MFYTLKILLLPSQQQQNPKSIEHTFKYIICDTRTAVDSRRVCANLHRHHHAHLSRRSTFIIIVEEKQLHDQDLELELAHRTWILDHRI